MWRFRGR
ncbi:hypothetical protein YPPY08_2254, partial [Yersinia pestis PY-08]